MNTISDVHQKNTIVDTGTIKLPVASESQPTFELRPGKSGNGKKHKTPACTIL